MLIVNTRRKNQIDEFIDKDRPVMDKYYTIFDGTMTRAEVKKLMRTLIKEDRDFYDTYHILLDLLLEEDKGEEALDLLEDAYLRAINRIVDKKGRWPKQMRWGHLENRHLMRIINRYGIFCWEAGNIEEALFIFRNFLQVCPEDNLGVRFYILAIHLKLIYEQWESLFQREDSFGGGLDALKMDAWFQEHAKKFSKDLYEYIDVEDENSDNEDIDMQLFH